MRNNLQSFGLLPKKGYSLKLEQDHLTILDERNRKRLKVPLSKNITFKIQITMVDYNVYKQSLVTKFRFTSWIWVS